METHLMPQFIDPIDKIDADIFYYLRFFCFDEIICCLNEHPVAIASFLRIVQEVDIAKPNCSILDDLQKGVY